MLGVKPKDLPKDARTKADWDNYFGALETQRGADEAELVKRVEAMPQDSKPKGKALGYAGAIATGAWYKLTSLRKLPRAGRLG